MTTSDRGDIVLVGFMFSDESARKFRPAVVISSKGYNRERQEVIEAAITINIRRRLFGDYLIADWKGAGLLFPSMATGILRTIKRAMIDRKIDSLTKSDLDAIDRELRRTLDL